MKIKYRIKNTNGKITAVSESKSLLEKVKVNGDIIEEFTAIESGNNHDSDNSQFPKSTYH